MKTQCMMSGIYIYIYKYIKHNSYNELVNTPSSLRCQPVRERENVISKVLFEEVQHEASASCSGLWSTLRCGLAPNS